MKKLLLFLFFLPAFCQAQLKVRVVDVGAGLCCIVPLPGNKFIVYDGGNGQSQVKQVMDSMMNEKSQIELLILSHTDNDHWGAVKYMVETYKVKKILKTDYRCEAYKDDCEKGMLAINEKGIECMNLGKLKPGANLYNKGGIKVQFLCGFTEPLKEWGIAASQGAKLNNSVSVVVKLSYQGKSVLFGGDAVGKNEDKKGQDCEVQNDCEATESFLLKKKSLLKADVMIAPHHGADNASCTDFIKAVAPKWVVFSSGNVHEHPNKATVQRYLDAGVKVADVYRTDLCDRAETTENKPACDAEWEHGKKHDAALGHKDDVQITLSKKGVKVKYVIREKGE